MKRLHNTLTAIFIFTLVFSSTSLAQSEPDNQNTLPAGKLIVKIDQVESDEGVIMLALYNSEESYEESNIFASAKVQIINGVAEHTFEDVPFSEYAIKCYHDENLNGKLDTNMFGIPSEGYGFSNNATGSFGPADYEDAKFQFISNEQTIEFSIQ